VSVAVAAVLIVVRAAAVILHYERHGALVRRKGDANGSSPGMDAANGVASCAEDEFGGGVRYRAVDANLDAHLDPAIAQRACQHLDRCLEILGSGLAGERIDEQLSERRHAAQARHGAAVK
jgi:hypothetical protein